MDIYEFKYISLYKFLCGVVVSMLGWHTLGRGFDPHIDSMKNGQHRREGWFTDRVSAPASAWYRYVLGKARVIKCQIKRAYGCTVLELTKMSSRGRP